ncbi:MAG: ATP-binding protein, partial [Pseudomonadota bacterium]|nr:ATP-binding protein [Pseudomonadota bacterium]
SPVLTLRAEVIKDQVVISVADNGPGITKQHLGHIFEPFFTTKAPGSGLGLGLSISSRIMEDLGGKLQATNLATGGACFTVTLPRSTAPEPSTARLKQENQPHA